MLKLFVKDMDGPLVVALFICDRPWFTFIINISYNMKIKKLYFLRGTVNWSGAAPSEIRSPKQSL
jgi:hypothetical protein